jgi:hypothetical protein
MRKPGTEGAPTADAFKQSEKTATMAQGGEVKKHATQEDAMQCEKCGHHMMMGGNIAMSHGGSYAEGGNVNEKLNPHHQPAMDPRLKKDIHAMQAPGMNVTAVGKLAYGGNVVDAIMKKRMAEGGEIESERDNEPAFEREIDFSNTHYLEDDTHDADENPSDDDHSLVGQIMSEREKKKRM